MYRLDARRSAPQQRFWVEPPTIPLEAVILASGLAAGGIWAGVQAGAWVGRTVGEFVQWMMDERGYWQARRAEALAALEEADDALATLDAASAKASAVSPDTVITG